MQVLRFNLQNYYCLRYPRKSIISFYLETNLFKRERRTGHGLSDEEKKDTSDSFELHLELKNSRGIAVVLIDFWFSKISLI